jgi:excisionase family DNA binding protein
MKRLAAKKNDYTLTPRQLAKELGFGLSNTYRMLAEGVLPSIRIGNRFYTPRSALNRWLETCGGESAAGLRNKVDRVSPPNRTATAGSHFAAAVV